MSNCYPLKWHKFFKAACGEHRQRILALISQYRTINASKIVKKINLSQPTVSHHLKILSEAGLILAEKKGKEVFYSVNEKNITSCCMDFMNKLIIRDK